MARRKLSGSGGGGGGGGHDGGGSLRWLLTYADMITLLMAFFIMMYSISVLDLAKFQAAAESFRSEFGKGQAGAGGDKLMNSCGEGALMPPILPFPKPPASDGKTSEEEKKGPGSGGIEKSRGFKKLDDFLHARGLSGVVRVRVEERGVVISLMANGLLFPAGSAAPTPACREVLRHLATAIHEVPNNVVVEGHTCNLPPRSAQYPSNWELSTARATNVIRFFIEDQRVPASRLAAAGYAASRPVVGNDSERNRAQNRRVDIVVLHGRR